PPAGGNSGQSFFGASRQQQQQQQQAPVPQQQYQQYSVQQQQQGSGNPAYDAPAYQQHGSMRGNPYSGSGMATDSNSAGSSASSMRPASAASSQSAYTTDHASAMSQALAPNGLPSANPTQGTSVKRSGILVIRVMEARNL
ncbi:hypothetical protein GGH92_011089, partial [Coemansia sp. RSA 2673]